MSLPPDPEDVDALDEAEGLGGGAVPVGCPWCGEPVELWVDPEQAGSFVEDCEICCRPWWVSVWREGGEVRAVVDRG